VVIRGDDVVVIKPARRSNHHEVWALPKGHPDGDETPLEAAIREVREEAGVEVDLIDELGEIEYTFERKGSEVSKRVAFFLFRYREGELAHDHEIAAVRWMPLQEAVHALTHAGERGMIQRALSRVQVDR
jgi:8-oxo-dGTP pyrophosphatase MutT (NUDIX family)